MAAPKLTMQVLDGIIAACGQCLAGEVCTEGGELEEQADDVLAADAWARAERSKMRSIEREQAALRRKAEKG